MSLWFLLPSSSRFPPGFHHHLFHKPLAGATEPLHKLRACPPLPGPPTRPGGLESGGHWCGRALSEQGSKGLWGWHGAELCGLVRGPKARWAPQGRSSQSRGRLQASLGALGGERTLCAFVRCGARFPSCGHVPSASSSWLLLELQITL